MSQKFEGEGKSKRNLWFDLDYCIEHAYVSPQLRQLYNAKDPEFMKKLYVAWGVARTMTRYANEGSIDSWDVVTKHEIIDVTTEKRLTFESLGIEGQRYRRSDSMIQESRNSDIIKAWGELAIRPIEGLIQGEFEILSN